MITVETTDAKEKLVQLIELQVYYNRLYTLLQREGDLPKQIQELEYQVQALRKQISDRKTELRHMENEIAQLHVSNDTLQDHIQKLEKTLLQLRSDEHVFRIETEIKEARLTIEKNRRDIRILSQKVEVLRNEIADLEEQLSQMEARQAEKQAQLDAIKAQTAEQRATVEMQIRRLENELATRDPRLYRLFERRIRVLREEKALVPVVEVTTDKNEKRVACGGCFTLLPRQLEWEIGNRNALYLCESCGRFLVDAGLFEEVAARLP